MMNFPMFVGQVTLRQRHQLPDNSGIYFIFGELEQLLYIGQAKSLKNRWAGSTHHRYKQFSRKGLDKIVIRYVLIPVSELNSVERNYINTLKPVFNDSKVKQYLPKTSPRFSELQRLLKLTPKPLFPSCLYKERNGETVLREEWDFFRGFVAGIYQNEKPHILVVCRQNIGRLVWESFSHRTKKRFWLNPSSEYWPAYFFFDARQAVFVFVEIYDCDLAEPIFQEIYPNLVDSQIAGVMVKKLVTPSLLKSTLEKTDFKNYSEVQNYLLNICENLDPLPTDLDLNQQMMW